MMSNIFWKRSVMDEYILDDDDIDIGNNVGLGGYIAS